MLGAIIGDIIGSVYEWNNIKTTEFLLFGRGSMPTDDSVMSIAVADGLIRSFRKDEETIKQALVASMQHYGRKYPGAGYGDRFNGWIWSENPKPYNSWGNGSAMRVSSVGWMAASLADAEELAKVTAEVTHNHEEGVRGAQAIAAVVYLARAKCSKEDIKAYIEKYYEYDLSTPLDAIRSEYQFDVSCAGSVPWAIRAFLEAESYEEAVRLAISIGGDSDTLACMAGAIAEPYFGIPEKIKNKALEILDDYLKGKLKKYRDFYHEKCAVPDDSVRLQVRTLVRGPYAGGNPEIEEALKKMLELVHPIPQDVQDLNAGAEAYQEGDFETAVRLYQKAADAGNVTALSNLGYCYYYGRSVPIDKEKARACWEKAAALGDICSIYKLGDMYQNGDLPKDPVFSKKLYMQAFQLAAEEMDPETFPDAFLRILKYCRDRFSSEDLKTIAGDCVEGLEERIRQGDNYSERLLQEAKEILNRMKDET